MDCISAPPHRQVKKAGTPVRRPFASRRFAVVAVDLIEKRITSNLVGYSSGTVSHGLRRFQELLSLAVKAGIPVIFVVPDERFPPELGSTVVPSLLSSAPGARLVTKGRSNSFAYTKLAGCLEERGADTLIIGGWDLQECVLATIRGALARDYLVVTSEQICFSDLLHIDRTRPPGRPDGHGPMADMRQEYQRALDFFRRNPRITYYAGFDGLMSGLKRALV